MCVSFTSTSNISTQCPYFYSLIKYKLFFYHCYWAHFIAIAYSFLCIFPITLPFNPTGLNENGEDVTWQASGWPARILQHEMDHLDGVLYIDRMDSKTFININWQVYNE